jgi:hypothetical protein
VLVLAGYLPTRALGGRAGVAAMATGQAVVAIVVLATLARALRGMRAADGAGRFRIALKIAGIRFAATVVLAGAIAWYEVVEPAAFLIWVGVSYVVLINVETLVLVHWTKRLEKTQR